jgi:hypothetical protein
MSIKGFLRSTGLNKPLKFASQAVSEPVRGVGRVLRGDFEKGFGDIARGGLKLGTIAGAGAGLGALAGAAGIGGGAGSVLGGMGKVAGIGAGNTGGGILGAVRGGAAGLGGPGGIGSAIKTGAGKILGGNDGGNAIQLMGMGFNARAARDLGRTEDRQYTDERSDLDYERQRKEMYDPMKMEMMRSMMDRMKNAPGGGY